LVGSVVFGCGAPVVALAPPDGCAPVAVVPVPGLALVDLFLFVIIRAPAVIRPPTRRTATTMITATFPPPPPFCGGWPYGLTVPYSYGLPYWVWPYGPGGLLYGLGLGGLL
jgi:hypothetical protein